MLKRVNFVSVPVLDQARALAFYTSKLGFKVYTDQTMGPMRWIELKLGTAETMVSLHATPGHVGTDTPVLALVADDVPRTHQELVSRGVEFLVPPTREPWGEYAVLRDSEGNRVLFARG